MALFWISQFPSLWLFPLLVLPFRNLIGDRACEIFAYGLTSIAQALLFAVYAYIMLYRPKKKPN
jgi:hypothetical protein